MNIQDFVSTAIGYPVEVIDVYSQNRGLGGQFFASGKIYDYRVSMDSLEYIENDLANAYLEGYVQSKIQQLGLRTDSDNPYEYLQGALFDPNARMDDKCVTGVPCGDKCLPRGSKCRLGDKLRGVLSSLTKKVKPANPEIERLQAKQAGYQEIVDRGLGKNVHTGAAIGATGGAVIGGLPSSVVAGGLIGAGAGAVDHHLAKRRVRKIGEKIKKLQS